MQHSFPPLALTSYSLLIGEAFSWALFSKTNIIYIQPHQTLHFQPSDV